MKGGCAVAVAVVVLLLLLCVSSPAFGKRETLKVRRDTRSLFYIDSFGFSGDGVINITVTNFETFPAGGNSTREAGFLVTAAPLTGKIIYVPLDDNDTCVLHDKSGVDFVFPMSWSPANSTWMNFHQELDMPFTEIGKHILWFAVCDPTVSSYSFDLWLEWYNLELDGVTRNYLSSGDSPLPTVYMWLTILFLVALAMWLYVILSSESADVRPIHWLMTLLMVFKLLSLFFESWRYSELKDKGVAEALSVLYYIFFILRGVMLYVVIVLLSMGWSVVRHFLNLRERIILIVVLVLQVFVNISLVVLEESSPGTSSYFSWQDVCKVLDIICCVLVLVPIFWSIRHLEDSAQSDGKVRQSIQMLMHFRQFYMSVIFFIYFTRIVVMLVDLYLPYNFTWVSVVAAEFSALVFFMATGWHFKPASNNPYLKLPTEESDALPLHTLDVQDDDNL